MNDERLGIVRFPYGGRTIPLRFTWERIDALGRNGLSEKMEQVDGGDAGGLHALAELLEIGSGGEVSAQAVMADPPPYILAYQAVVDAWLLALYGPNRKAEGEGGANPPSRLRTLFSRVFRRRMRRD